MTVSKEKILTQGYDFPLNAFQFLASAYVMEFHTIEAYSNLVLSRVKYNINKTGSVRKT